VNKELIRRRMPYDMFITIAVAVLDPGSGEIRYSSAGHDAIFWDGKESVMLEAGGVPLNVDPEAEFEETILSLGDEGMLVMHTDGIEETTNDKEEMWGRERLKQLTGARAKEGCRAVHDSILAEVEAFGRSQLDDRTLQVLGLAEKNVGEKRGKSEVRAYSGLGSGG